MAFYNRWIFPRLLDLSMRMREVARYRAALVPRARGIVVEIGIGSGLNLPFYGAAVEELYAVDPSPELLAMASERARATRFPVEFLQHTGEKLPLGDAVADTVLTTFTLCTIAEPVQALGEMKRILKPGGTLLFAEHGLAPEASVQRWQERLNPLWRKWAGGCNLNRKMDDLIRRAGYEILDLQKGYARGPRPMSYMYSGEALPIVDPSTFR